jgi:hypothetical protein
MAAEQREPFSIVFCRAMIRVAAQLVPAARRREWRQEWLAEIWHRWQFLLYTREWSRREAVRLFRNCLGAFVDAGWHFASQERVQSRVREWARSPWLCLGAIAGLLAVVGVASGWFPATRQLLFGPYGQRERLVFAWLHPIGGIEKGVPPDVVPKWAKYSQLLEGAAGFDVSHTRVSAPRVAAWMPLVVRTEPSLFRIFRVRPELGAMPESSGVVLDHRSWVSIFHANPAVIGSTITVGGESQRIAAVLPASFQFLSRQPSVYLVQHELTDEQVMVVGRTKPGVTERPLDRELERIAQDKCYYFFGPDLRLRFLQSAVVTPLRFFGMAVAIAILLLLMVSRISLRRLRAAWEPGHKKATLRRCAFFAAKAGLALVAVFTAGLEWSRSDGSFLFASQDPANGPFLVWLYILGAMGVLFWSLADQRARCRVCLRLLCFPVRIGCPGCLLLDWSGTELLCAEGHGVLHVPHMAPSWEEAEHWIGLDESWRELFAHE